MNHAEQRATLIVRVLPETRRQLEILCRAQDRNLNGQLNRAIKEHLERHQAGTAPTSPSQERGR